MASSSDAPRIDQPWFSPLWYLSTYPDVAASGIDPQQHFADLGWREGRDPSGLFSTNWYLRRNPDVAALGINPLDHYLRQGRAERRVPHPGLGPTDHANPRVAVIVVSFNAPAVVELLLTSLAAARNKTPFKIFLVENGSTSETKATVQNLVREHRDHLDLRVIDSATNLGFSGGNNLGMKAALCENFTHVCLLNSDVVCTTGWLDQLIETGAPVVSPVSNAVGNEQTVAIDYDALIAPSAIDHAERFAAKRAATFARAIVRSDFLGFFCVLLERTVIERVGFLDEQFFPGSYEDDDYCVRLLKHGYELVIARHVFLHHFGSASFSTLAWSERVAAGDGNRRRFETKWGRPWSDRTHLPALSGVQDSELYIARDERDALLAETLRRQGQATSRLTQGLVQAVRHYRDECEARERQIQQISAGVVMGEPGGTIVSPHLRRIDWGDTATPVAADASATFTHRYRQLLRDAWEHLEGCEFVSFSVLEHLQPFVSALALLFIRASPIFVLTQLADPVTSDEKDGYVQRVRAVDRLLEGRARLYVHVDERHRSSPALTQLADDIWRLEIADKDALGEALLRALFRSGANIYAHSIFGLQGRSVRRLLVERSGVLVLDLHGSVPEEFAMHQDGFGAQVFNEIEAAAAPLCDRIITVSKNMARHIEQKHLVPPENLLVFPIFVEAGRRDRRRPYLDRPRVVYAGGTQRWQQIDKMAGLVVADDGRSDFLFLTPNVSVMAEIFAKAEVDSERHSFTIRASSHADVLALYSGQDFGLLLREDSVVNRVACPTKLIEYITFGVVPILDTPRVGDFGEMRIAYVPVGDYARGRIPPPAERREMAQVNFRILDQLKRQMQDGSAEVKQIVIGQVRTAA